MASMFSWFRDWMTPRRASAGTAPQPANRNITASVVPGIPSEVEVSRALAQSLVSQYSGIRQIRTVLAKASRAEDQRSGYYTGMLNRVARTRVGSGPKLRVFFDHEDWNRALTDAWSHWCQATKFAKKLRVGVRDAARDGATVAFKYTNKKLRTPVKLDLRFMDSLRITHPWDWNKPYTNHVDGIDFDKNGEPVKYYVDRGEYSEGGGVSLDPPIEYRPEDLIHYFTARSAEQFHGLPEAAAGLLLYPNLRRYVEAVIKAAVSHASVAYTLENANGSTQEYTPDPFGCVPLEPNIMQELPAGYKLNAVNPTQPGNNHEMLIHSMIGECAACFDMPLIMAINNAGGANFSSANFDVMPFEDSTKAHRIDIATDIVDPVFGDWYQEAILHEGLLPAVLRRKHPTIETIPHGWGWPRVRRHADPLKETEANRTALATGETTLLRIWEENGEDCRAAIEAECKMLGVKFEDYVEMLMNARFGVKQSAEETQRQESMRLALLTSD